MDGSVLIVTNPPSMPGSSPMDCSAQGSTPTVVLVLTDRMTGTDRQRQTLIESLRVRFAKAVADNDAEAKAALFKEAVYLGIQPDDFTGPDLDQTA